MIPDAAPVLRCITQVRAQSQDAAVGHAHCPTVQVADALGDKRFKQWSRLLAQRTADICWSGVREQHHVHEDLLQLPITAGNAVLQELLVLLSPDEALTGLPSTMHSSLVSAMIQSNGSLTSPGGGSEAASAFIAQLPRLRRNCSSHANISSLQLIGTDMQPGIQHVFRDVLPSLCSLSRLVLGAKDCSIDRRVLIKVLPTLQLAANLRRLEIAASFNSSCSLHALLTPSALGAVRTAMCQLPGLRHLSFEGIGCVLPDHLGTPVTSSAGNVASQKQYAQFIAAVAAHPGLTSLHFTRSAATAPLVWMGTFPQLQELKLTDYMPGVYDCEIDVLSAASKAAVGTRGPSALFPCLSSLDLCLHARSDTSGQIPCAEHWLALQHSCSEFPLLRTLCVKVVDGCWSPPSRDITIWEAVSGAPLQSS